MHVLSLIFWLAFLLLFFYLDLEMRDLLMFWGARGGHQPRAAIEESVVARCWSTTRACALPRGPAGCAASGKQREQHLHPLFLPPHHPLFLPHLSSARTSTEQLATELQELLYPEPLSPTSVISYRTANSLRSPLRRKIKS